MAQLNQQSRKQRVVILTKGDMMGLLCLSSGEQGIRVISTDPRRPTPSVRVHENRNSATAEFNEALAGTLERGWTVVYDGEPLFG